MKRNERTSARVAKIAGRFLAADYVGCTLLLSNGEYKVISSDDAKALAASALTQTANRPKPKKYGPLVLRPGITLAERKRAKALIAASAKKPKKPKKRVRK